MKKVKFVCDVCGKVIKEGYEEYHMVKIVLSGTEYKGDDGSELYEEEYYCHAGKCSSKIYGLLEGKTKK